MKELSIEEKAKRYDEAVINGSRLWECGEITRENYENIFPELRESEDKRIRDSLLEYLHTLPNHYAHSGVYAPEWISWLKKQGEQPQGKSALEAAQEVNVDNQNCVKPTDKVEPKFHKGEWIIFNGLTLFVKEVGKGFYRTYQDDIPDGYYWYIDNVARLWTIQDAKDGNMLCYKDEISLYKHDIKNCTKQEITFGGFVYYCCYDGKRFITDSLYSLTEQDKMNIHPATKDQRDLLFSKMKEAGYEWNPDKKELKKIESRQEELTEFEKSVKQVMEEAIECGDTHNLKADADMLLRLEQKPAWSEEDNIILNEILSFIPYHLTAESYKKFTNWLKSFRNRVQPQLQIQQEWNEKDLTMIESIIQELEPSKYRNTNELKINWLKSLKDRVQPQPKQEWSEEDEENFNWFEKFFRAESVIVEGKDIPQDRYLWFKNLKERVQPQNTWKPSDEQLDTLERVVSERQSISLESLYEDIRKLKY